MLQWNELRITPDNKCLIIDVSVDDIEYFKNVTIDSIWIDTQDTWIPSGPSGNAIKVYSQPQEDALEEIYTDTNVLTEEESQVYVRDNYSKRNIRLEIQKPILDLSKNNMYFVYVIADVSKAPEYTQAPCTCSNEKLMGTVVNVYPLYSTLMGSLKEIVNTCGQNKNFIDSFLRLQSIEASIKAGNYPMAIKYWNRFFAGNIKSVNYKSCGCNGRT